MTTEEMNAIFTLAEINEDGKFDYSKVSLDKYEISFFFFFCMAVLGNKKNLLPIYWLIM